MLELIGELNIVCVLESMRIHLTIWSLQDVIEVFREFISF